MGHLRDALRLCGSRGVALAALAAILAAAAPVQPAAAQGIGGFFENLTANVVFIHPDGTALNHWNAARMYWADNGPDGDLEWDQLPEMAVYRGHMSDQLTGTSNGGATVHAFGVKVQGPESYGRDRGRPIYALSGYPGSIMREAANRGRPVGIINDGDIAGEPGTGVFLAESDNRGQPELHSLQLIAGRPGFNGDDSADPASAMIDGIMISDPEILDGDVTDGENDPVVILGGGEQFFLPEGTPRCEDASEAETLSCFVHFDVVDAADEVADGTPVADAIANNGPTRDDGRNLLQEAAADGYLVVRTREQFDALYNEVMNAGPLSPFYAPKVLGLFAANDIFNDEEEEELASLGITRMMGDPLPTEEQPYAGRLGNLTLWGAPNGPFGPNGNDFDAPLSVNPPTIAEMGRLAMTILERRARDVFGRLTAPYLLVAEVESADNLPNNQNAIGMLRALKRTDTLIGVAREFEGQTQLSRTLILTAADSDGSGPQVLALRRGTTDTPFNPLACDSPGDPSRSECAVQGDDVSFTTVNPVGSSFESFGDPESRGFVDGIEGRTSPPFEAEADAVSALRTTLDGFPDEDGTGLGSFGGLPVDDEQLPFAIVWPTVNDTAGGILSRAQGLYADRLRRGLDSDAPGCVAQATSLASMPLAPSAGDDKPFYVRFDNTDVYRMMYLALFATELPSSVGFVAGTRGSNAVDCFGSSIDTF